MKNYIVFLFLILIGTYSNLLSASISSNCNIPSNTTYMWIFEREILVIDHPDIPGLTAVKSSHDATGDWYQNLMYKGSLGPLNSYEIGTPRDVLGGGISGPVVMRANASGATSVTRYLNAGQSNQSNITWNVVCIDGEFSGYLNGSWVVDPSLDRFNCFFRTTE